MIIDTLANAHRYYDLNPRLQKGFEFIKTLITSTPEPGKFPSSDHDRRQLRDELLQLGAQNSLTADISRILFHRSLPVDTRHNVKINRELLAAWAARQAIAK